MLYKKASKKPFLLLEVMIAIALITLCILPMLSPFVRIYQAERNSTREIHATLVLSQLHVSFIERLHKIEIPWGDLVSGEVQPLSSPALAALGYEGYRLVTISKNKPPKDPIYFLFNIDYLLIPSTFTPLNPSPELFQSPPADKKTLKIHYKLFASRLPPKNAETPLEEEEAEM